MASKGKSSNEAHSREANVLLELRMVEPMSAEVLDANSDDVMNAVVDHASNVALGPAVAINPHDCAIKLRFDVLAKDDVDIHKQVAKVVAIILRETDLKLVMSRSSVEAHEEAESPADEFAAA